MKKKILIPTVSLFAICLVASFLLGFANEITADKIQQNSIVTEQQSQKKVIAEASDFGEKTEGDITLSSGETQHYTCVEAFDEAKNTVGYVFVTSSTGYGGAIKIMTGVSPDGAVTGIEFLEINETVGLGMNAKKDSFKNQFISLKNGINVTKGEKNANEVKALTGATITSKAVTKGVNTALEIFESKYKAEVKDNG